MGEHVIPTSRMARGNVTAAALLVGAALGLLAQLLRQMRGESMQLGAATAPWLTLGFALAVWAAERRAAGRVLTANLLAWLIAYQLLFAVRQSVSLTAALHEALPWLLLTPVVCVALAPIAVRALSSGMLGDFSLAAPIAWSLPEMFDNAQRGDVLVATAIAVIAVIPVVAAGRRSIQLATLVVAVVALGTLALLVGPVLRGLVHS